MNKSITSGRSKTNELDEYKQQIADLYDRRSPVYDDNNWLLQICQRLIEYSQIRSGDRILDIGTGTGHLAFAAAKIVGDTGRVIGVDISVKTEFEAELAARVTKQGVWDDLTTWYAIARKPKDISYYR